MIDAGNGFGFMMSVPPASYREGGFYDPPSWLDEEDGFVQLAPRTKLLASSKMERAAPVAMFSDDLDFVEGLKGHFGQINVVYGYSPPVFLTEIPAAHIKGNVIYATADGRWDVLYETYRPNDRPYTTLAAQAELSNVSTRFGDDLDTYWLGSAGSGNYGHWLVDDLSRAIWLSSEGSRKIRLLISSNGPQIDEVKQQSIEMLTGREDLIVEFIDPQHTVLADRLLYISPNSYHPTVKSQIALTALRNVISSRCAYNQATRRRLFVDRAPGITRSLSNAAEIEDLLVRYGFETTYPERMSFEAQATAFCEAEVVIGVMGAAMTNTVFCKPGTPICHLAPIEWSEPFYWDLASMMQHRYVAIFGRASRMGEPPHMSDFEVDPKYLRAAMKIFEL